MARTASPASGASLALIGSLFLLAALPAAAEGPGTASTATERGLHTTTFHTDRGDVEVYLPDDLAAGDTLSGTVVARPSGRTEATTRRNADRLEGYVVDFGEQRAEVRAVAFSWRVSTASGTSVPLVLRDERGHQVARATVPVAPAAGPSVAAGITAPPVGQTGRPLAIGGDFDGRFETSRVTVGGQEASLLAESPRKVVVESPLDVVGETTLVVNEGDATSEQPFRNVGIGLSAPRTNLRRGERTTLKVEVRGLEGLEAPIPIRIRNETPAVVRIEGGDTQTIEIRPAEVAEDGRYVATREITAKTAGGFGISAWVAVPEVGGGSVADALAEPEQHSPPAADEPKTAQPSEHRASARVTPNGTLIVEVSDLPPGQDAVVADPDTGNTIATGRTTASGRLVVRQGNSRVKPGDLLLIRCGEALITVKVEG